MKGTLFSADFIEDLDGNLRLLEINTDTQASTNNLAHFDYSDFISVLDANNITKVFVVNKPNIHKDIVNHLSQSLNVSASFITTFTTIDETPNTIYPTNVTDESDLFILRLAYDEAAIFDSEYAKGTLNLLTLFADYNETGSVPEFYHSSSAYGYYNNLTPTFNPSNLPDIVVKDVSELHNFASFYKIGSEVEGESALDRYNAFKNDIVTEDTLLEKYYINSNTEEDDKVSSIRTYSIIYGGDLSLIHLAQYKSYSAFSLPTASIFDENLYVNKIDNKHYYEFATNIVKYEGVFDGILDTHLLINSDNVEIEAGSVSVGDSLKSYYIGDTSLDEGSFDYQNWQINGNTFPSGSYITSSIVIFKNTKPLSNKTLTNIFISGSQDSIFVASNKSFLVYDSNDDIIKWKMAFDIEPEIDSLLDYDGSAVEVTSNELLIINEDGFNLVEIDVEDTDTYIIAGETPINSFVTHNAPCFVKGTKVTLADGSTKNIEDIVPGDVVCTFDLKNNEVKNNIVNAVYSKKVNKIIEYKFDNGETIRCTPDHPIYVDGKGWASFDSLLSNGLYSLESSVNSIEVGDSVKLLNGESKILSISSIDEEVIVYNLQDIEGNHNFFANNILVHNRFCFVAGTEITLENGEIKNIENIEVGDIVLSFNEQTGLQEYNKVTNIFKPKHDDLVEYTLSNGKKIISTFDHPYYVNGLNLASYSPELTTERYKDLSGIVGIQVGDELNLQNNEKVSIVSISEKDRVLTETYIFTVENNHNFYANGVLVHNKCFIAGTLIALFNNDFKNIEDVIVGDEVVSYNELTGENEIGIVGDLKTHNVDLVVRLTFDDENEITTTPEHPFFIEDMGWVKAGELKVGSVCKKIDGTKSEILSVECLNETHTVYNLLSVSNNHNFYANNILVHNKL